MKDKPSFTMSQDLEVMAPVKEKGYGIPVREWADVRQQLSDLDSGWPWFNTVGSVFLGASVTCAITALTANVLATLPPSTQESIHIQWIIAIASAVVGAAFLLMEWQHRKIRSTAVESVIHQMELIEQRFPPV